MVVPFIITIILLIGLAGYICYDKFYKKESTKTNEKEINKKDQVIQELSSPINSLDDLKKLNYDDKLMGYWNYGALYEYYYTIKDNTLPNAIDKELQKYIKVKDGNLYWFINGKWNLDERINGYINGISAKNSGYEDMVYIEIFTKDGYIYVIETNGYLYDDVTFSDIYKTRVYYEVKYDGNLQAVDYKRYCECECVQTTFVKIDNQIYSLTPKYDNGGKYSEFILNLKTTSESPDAFENAIYTCGPRIQNLSSNGYLTGISNSNEKIKVKDYISIDDADEPFALIIDDTNNLYVMYYISEDNDDMAIKKIDTIKDIKFVYQENEKSYGYIVLSDGYKKEFNFWGSVFPE